MGQLSVGSLSKIVSIMSSTKQPTTPKALPVKLREAASVARVHLNSIYRLHEGVLYIPIEARYDYVQ
jgi:hypothetical protein